MINSQYILGWIVLTSCFYNGFSQDYFEGLDGTGADDDQHDGMEIQPLVYETQRHAGDDVPDSEPSKPADTTSRRPNDKPDCEHFTEYITRCTDRAKSIYNSTQNAPPLTGEVLDWCKSVKLLSQCTAQWNSQCRKSSERVNAESVKGHQSVVQNICENEAYLERYKWNSYCVPQISDEWSNCYTRFKAQVDALKNGNSEWTHYEIHFKLCCMRAQFRRCTLQALSASCTDPETIVLQKFSVIVSEAEVFQNCEIGVVYEKCPGGDPRPDHMILSNRENIVEDVQRYSRGQLVTSTAFCMSVAVALCSLRPLLEIVG